MLRVEALLQPSGPARFRSATPGVIVLLVASAICVLVAPLTMPDSYSWISNAISESAAQGPRNAWIARLGFLLFGCAVLWLAVFLRLVWARSAYWMLLAFGLFMISAGVFSHKPWLTNLPFDLFEDVLHSVAATGMGMAFSFGVVARFLQRDNGERLKKTFDVVALLAATTLPPLGLVWPHIAGFLQRAMFLIAYLWFAHEALTARSAIGNASGKMSAGSA